MRHGFKKTKFADGIDADRMLMRKLTVNFFTKGKISTTFSKIKALRPEIERTVTKIKKGTEADKNYLLRKLGDSYKSLSSVFKEVSSQLSKVQSGYTKIVKLGYRESDGAPTASLEWAYPVVLPSAKKTEAKTKEVPAAKANENKKKEVKE